MTDQTLPEIVSLRIPSGWCVVYNNFFEVDPIVENNVFLNADYFSEDMLLIERNIQEGAKWLPLLIDVGWYPAENINGRYKVILASGNFENRLYVYETKDRLEVCKTIEKWMLILAIAQNEQEVHERLVSNEF